MRRVPGVIIGSAAVAPTGSHFLAVRVGGERAGRRGHVGAVGPPMACVYQHADPRVTRFTSSPASSRARRSVAALMATGSGTRQWRLAGLILPGPRGSRGAQMFAARLRSDAPPARPSRCAPLLAIALVIEEST